MTLLLSVIDEMYGKSTLSLFFFKKAPNSSKLTALLCILTS